MKTKNIISLFVIILLIGLVGYIALNGMSIGIYDISPVTKEIKQGLDLKGGLYVIYEAKVDPNEPNKDTQIEGAMRVMRNRLDKENQNEATIAKQGNKWIRVEIPGVKDPREVANILSKPAVLKFIDSEGNEIIGGKDIKNAQPGYGEGNQPVVMFELYKDGAKAFGEATKNNIGKTIKIELDGNVISAPTVQTAILGGSGQITGMENIEEAKKLANLIESGALPVELEQIEIRTIGATLGSDALTRSIKAGLIGTAVVLLFMLIYYRLPGLVADMALVLYILLVLIILSATQVTLTLPGIAGIILSVGMAVDANVIIFERIKEEMQVGKTIKSAVDSGFHKAFSAIFDSNITTIIAGIVLWIFGTGPIQGFAKTLIIGVLVSMLTAITFTKYVMHLVVGLNSSNKKLYGA
ncbi:MAG: protein translocase subunit SecD [Xylanivirga thermophila]|jgi:preprotein translocase subunit SecD|uniref:protein translocase subunit SecD n=1 Tax=Xylanivirga thermophila TaxID=2496273 RepID=UPI00101CABDC|nr:protein translocase subunit SecD [Xylanivirga thermophila]